ncbi:hypothetical protein D9M72_603140 [compost metagenome]
MRLLERFMKTRVPRIFDRRSVNARNLELLVSRKNARCDGGCTESRRHRKNVAAGKVRCFDDFGHGPLVCVFGVPGLHCRLLRFV